MNQRNVISRAGLSAVLLCLALTLSACLPKELEVSPVPPPVQPYAPTETGALPEPTPSGINPLSGLPIDEQWVNKRPVAIMLNNLKKALPQLGQSQADIIYECMAEGGITRMLGVYQSVEGVGMIGSVRSSRPYYLELALGLDAVYLHAGGSPDAYAKIDAWGVTALDGVNGPYEGKNPGDNLFWRDKERKRNKGLEHSVVTTGDNILEKFAGYTFRQEHNAGYRYDMLFAPDGTPVDGEIANVVKVPFSNYKTGVFSYDPETGRYLIQEYGMDYVDGNTGEQVGVTNVLVLKTAVTAIRGDSYGRVTVDLSGGTGYFACGGKAVEIRWSKGYPDGQLRYTSPGGAPLVLGRGHSYVNIVPLNCDVTFE